MLGLFNAFFKTLNYNNGIQRVKYQDYQQIKTNDHQMPYVLGV